MLHPTILTAAAAAALILTTSTPAAARSTPAQHVSFDGPGYAPHTWVWDFWQRWAFVWGPY